MSPEDFTLTPLHITRPDQRDLPTRFFRHSSPPDRLAIILPGMRYNCDKPLLYFTSQVLAGRDADLVQIWTDYTTPEFEKLSQEQQATWMMEDVLSAIWATQSQRRYHQLILAGKSIGTLTMALLLNQEGSFRQAITIWLTPLSLIPQVTKALRRLEQPAFFVGGTADRSFDLDILAEVSKNPQATVLTIPGANHSLEIPGEPLKTLQAQTEVMQSMWDFLR